MSMTPHHLETPPAAREAGGLETPPAARQARGLDPSPTGDAPRHGLEAPSRPRDFLLATWDGGGHAAPMLSVARALLARGHSVRVLADPVLAAEVEASGATFVPWRRAPHRTAQVERTVVRDWEARSPAAAFAHLRDELMCGPAGAFAADVEEELGRRRADAILADHLLLGASIGGEAAGVPAAALATTLLGVPGWGVPPTGSGRAPARGPLGRAREALIGRLAVRLWSQGLPAVNAARAERGLAPIEDPVDLVAGWDRVLVASSAALEFPTWAPPEHVRLVGPRLDDPAWAAPWRPPAGDAPLVLVSLSSSAMDQVGVLGRAAAALGRLPVRGLVTTGPAVDPASISAPANVRVVRSAPHTEVLRHAAAVVTHAGHGTVAKTLAAGVPLVALPLGRDQPDVAARVVASGAGLRLRPDSSPDRIAAAVRRVLGEPGFAEAARRAARIVAAERREDLVVAELEALAAVPA